MLPDDGAEEPVVQERHQANGSRFVEREEETAGNTVLPQNGTDRAHSVDHILGDGKADAQPVETGPELDKAMERERKRQARKRKRDAQRMKRRMNTSVYISGVPTDTTEEQLAEHFAKCGIILPSADTGRPRVKLYTDESGNPKGDALVTYAMEPSVENAVTILDGVPLRPGGQAMKVQRASFDHKKEQGTSEDGGPAKQRRTEGDEEKKPRAGFRSRDLVQEALSWAEEGQEVAKAPRIVILKNVFDANDADYDIVREDMEEGGAACGTVEKVTVFESNAEGTVAVKFTTLEACVQCIKVMNGRWYDGRKLSAEFYDGETDYRYKETEKDRSERERKWQDWLEHGEENVGTDTASAQPDR